MEWKKAKTYMITTLLILNTFLIWSIFLDFKNFKETDIDDLKTELEIYLDRMDIHLKTDIAKELPKLSPLETDYTDVDDTTYPEFFSKFDPFIIQTEKKILKAQIPEAALKDFHSMYMDEFSYKFIKTYFKEDYDLKYAYFKDNNYYSCYTPTYEGYPIEDAFLKIDFDYGKKTLSIEKVNIHATPTYIEARTVISPIRALTQVACRMKKGDDIDEIKLIYYYKAENEPGTPSIKKARALPTWRIKSVSGKFYYVYALY